MKKTLFILSAFSLLAGSVALASKVKANEGQNLEANTSVDFELTNDDHHGKIQEENRESDEAKIHEHEDEDSPSSASTASPVARETPSAVPTPTETPVASPTASASPTQAGLVLGAETSLNLKLQILVNQLINLIKKIIEK